MISVCMITKNEADCIAQCIDSVQELAAQIVVYDTGSGDDTCKIAESLGAKLIRGGWKDDFAWARNQSLAFANQEWVLILDADERLLPAAIDIIRAAVESGVPRVFDLPIHNLTDPENPDDGVVHYAPRLFPREGVEFEGVIHEQVVSEYERFLLPGATIMHTGYLPDRMESKGKLQRNLPLLKLEVERGKQKGFALFNLANALHAIGQREEAAEAFRKSIDAYDGGPVPSYLSGAFLTLINQSIESDDIQRAWEMCIAAEFCSHNNPDYWICRGGVLVAKGRISEGVYSCLRAYELGQSVLTCCIHHKSSTTTRPWEGISRAYTMAGYPEIAELFDEAAV